ncbi:FAD-dependent oxidoreductase [Nocardia sp. CDC160]|uniref:FAD-dependent oxidoreductase n=1 Tax=Nocardia sp. CDC160 TaxID=3112166 RepID=UPI002DB9BC54|nr:NAD(P)/FAD-dependent oxidoreductase [Nocardia sp. CDC160]MEC3918541.1 NAD(P)/FAD-dependent oxidoreductase [Nocardia sp. CDC160]
MNDSTRVLIVGGGVGGLTLAQALHTAGVDVVVYEQDPTPQTRNQGYRIHIDPDGNAALGECLDPQVFDVLRRSSSVNGDLVTTFTSGLELVSALEFPGIPEEMVTAVDRNAFRRGLLTGLNEVVRFGRTVSDYRITESGRVRVEFAEGGSDEGDLLVGADGVGSVIRRRLLPNAVVEDFGLRCIYGRMTLTGSLDPDEFNRGLCWVTEGSTCGAGFGPVIFRTPEDGRPDYLMVTLCATPARLGVIDDELFGMSAQELWKLSTDVVSNWHPAIRDIYAHSDIDSFFPITFRISAPVDNWGPGPVTLLGDAIHTMPPTAGVGANTALADAATLAHEILSATKGEKSLTTAVADYQTVMLPRGQAAIGNSRRMAAQMFVD